MTATALSVSDSSIPTVSASATPSTPVTQSDRDDLILSTLNAINAKVTALDGRVLHTERALADQTTHPVNPIAATSDSQNANTSNVATPTALSVSTAVVPTTDYLKNNLDIQKQVDARFVELHNAQVLSSSTGKLKSQRGGLTDVPIKKFVAWPQHYVLIGPDRRRPTYDELDPTKFMAGRIKGALDLTEPDRSANLKYLANLLEDASDFNFDNAKACHAVVLTTMEQDQVSWQDTSELDRFRRQHAQRHDNPAKNSHSKKSDNATQPKEMLCKYFNNSQCFRQKSHLTKGTWFLHLCSKCRGEHSARKCGPKNQ